MFLIPNLEVGFWLSEEFRRRILGVFIPAFLTLLIASHDFGSLISLPTYIRTLGRYVFFPFKNFLSLEDLEEAPLHIRILPPVWKNRYLTFANFLEVLVHITIFIRELYLYNTSQAIIDLICLLSWVYVLSHVLWKPPTASPYLLLLFYASCTLSAFLEVLSSSWIGSGGLVVLLGFHFIVPASLFYVCGTFPLMDILPSPFVATDKENASNLKSMPEDSVTLWQWCTFSFISPIFSVAKQRRLEHEDVWSLSPYFKHKNLFKKYLNYRSLFPDHSLIWFLIVSNFLDLIICISLELWNATVGFIAIYSMQRILEILAEDSKQPMQDAYLFAFITFMVHLSFAQADLIQLWHSRRSYERARGQLFCVIHHKALRRLDLSGRDGRSPSSVDDKDSGADLGKIANLMSGDAYTVALRFWQASSLFALIVRLIISLVFLHQLLGWSSMAGVVVVLVAYVVNFPLGKYKFYVTRHSFRARDSRMSNVNEIFQNIRFLKYYGWENLWAQRVLDSRELEFKWRVKENICALLIQFIWMWVPSAMTVFSFLFYTLVAHGHLTVAKAFTSIALFGTLQGPMLELPNELFAFLDAYVSLQRINAFLLEEEIPTWALNLRRASNSGSDNPIVKFGFAAATFTWHRNPDQSSNSFYLGPLDINFPIGQLTLISGGTASGKSALLAALLGEMRCVNGEVFVDKSNHQVAYCAQNPWLEHASIRDNIIFGSRAGYDESRYKCVISACDLERDFALFDAGDMTEIGEKGVTLSGGQRARVALARAMYSEAKYLLLDDPLAAVDMHTAQHIVDHCLRGPLMRGRTVILVTHHVSLCLSSAAYLVELSRGKILHQGSVKDLQASGELKTVIETEATILPQTTTDPIVFHANEADIEEKNILEREPTKGKLVEAEHRATGRVTLNTYLTYIRAAGWLSWFLTLCLMIFLKLTVIASDIFLARWAEAYEKEAEGMIFNKLGALLVQSPSILYSPLSLPSPDVDPRPWLMIYSGLSILVGLISITDTSLGYYASMQASRKLFSEMLSRLIRAPSRFFDVTPIGRILNRFTLDVSTVDSTLRQSARAALTGGLSFLISFLFIIWIIPHFAPIAIVIAWLYIRLAPPYVQAARDLRRLESVSLSPAFAGFDELLRGLSHIRAFGMEHRYQESFYRKVDTFQAFDHVYWLVTGWLSWRYDCLGSVVVYATTMFALWAGVSSGFAAIVISQAGIFAAASRQLVRVSAQLELDFNSVERIGEYLRAPQEARTSVDDKRPPAHWPSAMAQLIVENLVVRYAPDLPPVLDGISFTINANEKIGVVGRTGSGKSTLALSLLRIIEPSEGKIILDDIDINTIGLEDLRTKITIVSQDVSLFTGTLRSNLDPFGEHSDLECWDVLRRCHLVGDGTGHSSSLDLESVVTPTGSFSAGERQLVALARAILRRSQVVIMDEATSQIDVALDDQIQRTIREELTSAMVITIAHRLKTIIDYDRILVLGESGKIIEFDTPRNLLNAQDSAFGAMCRRSADWNDLKHISE